jgi:hypothetical protein
MARPAVTDQRVLEIIQSGPGPWTINTIHEAVPEKSRSQVHRSLTNLLERGTIHTLEDKAPGGAFQYAVTIQATRSGNGGTTVTGSDSGTTTTTITTTRAGAVAQAHGEGLKLGNTLVVVGLRLAGETIITVADEFGNEWDLTRVGPIIDQTTR